MDNLVNLDWIEEKKPEVNKNISSNNTQDAFANLLQLNTRPKAEVLSLAEQQRQQVQKNLQSMKSSLHATQASSSPWLFPMPSTPSSSHSPRTVPMSVPASVSMSTSASMSVPVPMSFSSSPTPTTTTTTNISLHNTFDSLLDPFAHTAKTKQDTHLPLNALRVSSPSTFSTIGAPSATTDTTTSEQWNFDIFNAPLKNKAASPNPTCLQSIDPFDIDFLHTEANQSVAKKNDMAIEVEDENPLGLLAGPVVKPQPKKNDFPISPTLQTIEQRSKKEVHQDAMLAQLVEMGFNAELAMEALKTSDATDLESVLVLLAPETEQQQREEEEEAFVAYSDTERTRQKLFASEQDQSPRTVKREPRREESGSKEPLHQVNEAFNQHKERLVAQATEMGGILFKNASMFMKTGREKITKAVDTWQEQQRGQSSHQGSPSRPRWMKETVEEDFIVKEEPLAKFVDEQDSDEEQSMHRRIETRKEFIGGVDKEMERQRLIHSPVKANALFQKPKEKAPEAQDTYISPSRRRPAPKPAPQASLIESSSSIQTPIVTRPVVKEKQRTRPVVQASPEAMAGASQAQQRGNDQFKLGQFGEAAIAYSKAIDLLPEGHDHLVLLLNSRAAAQFKVGEYKECIKDCSLASEMAQVSGRGSTESEGTTIHWKEQIIKSLTCKADACENSEKYSDALKVYEELVNIEGMHHLQSRQGIARCKKILGVEDKKAPLQTSVAARTTIAVKKESIPSSRSQSPSTSSVTYNSSGKALAAMRAQAAQQEAEDAEKLEKTDEVNVKLMAWKAGKEQNLRALLATLDILLWPGAQWNGAQMSELVHPKKCKMVYLRAIAKVHPDKLSSSTTIEQRMLASAIFSTLNEAWDIFRQTNTV
ncbi:hypothetical protein BDF14DRAFT_1801559 [Spinellus fusiger]|nr:hypothetical protein BDF14DRAFT_1801559 [Spinellus fusiger]